MVTSEECKHPLAWTTADFTLDNFDLVFLPGGHEKSVRQVIDSSVVHKLLVDYYPKTKKPSHKVIGAVCHGVMALSNAKSDDGKSVLHGCVTTALPARFEQLAYWGTRVFLGDYYKTYGAGSEEVEVSVCPSYTFFLLRDCKFVFTHSYPGAKRTRRLYSFQVQLDTDPVSSYASLATT